MRLSKIEYNCKTTFHFGIINLLSKQTNPDCEKWALERGDAWKAIADQNKKGSHWLPSYIYG